MEKYRSIYEFADGDLPTENEEELFSLLAGDPDARAELKQVLAIKEAVKSDSKAFTPPLSSTNAIFSSLGFASPAIVAQAPQITKLHLLKDWAALHSKSIITGISSAGLTAALFLLFFKPYAGYVSNNNYVEKSKTDAHSFSQSVPFTDSRALPAENQNELPKEKVVYKYIVVERQVEAPSNSVENIAEAPSNIVEIPSLTKDESSSQLSLNTNMNLDVNLPNQIDNGQNYVNMPIEQFNFKPQVKTGERVGLAFEMRGMQYKSSVKENVNPDSKQPLNNSSITLLYEISPELSLGVDYARENFYQKFEGAENRLESSGTNYFQYEQNPNFETYGVVVRYIPNFANFQYIKLLTQGSLGGNKVGYVGRVMLGTEIEPIRNYSLILGYDYSSMFYPHQNKWYNSNKKGFQIGAAVKF